MQHERCRRWGLGLLCASLLIGSALLGAGPSWAQPEGCGIEAELAGILNDLGLPVSPAVVAQLLSAVQTAEDAVAADGTLSDPLADAVDCDEPDPASAPGPTAPGSPAPTGPAPTATASPAATSRPDPTAPAPAAGGRPGPQPAPSSPRPAAPAAPGTPTASASIAPPAVPAPLPATSAAPAVEAEVAAGPVGAVVAPPTAMASDVVPGIPEQARFLAVPIVLLSALRALWTARARKGVGA